MAKVHIIVSRRVTFMEQAIAEIDLPDFIVEDHDALYAAGTAYANSHCDDLQNLPFEKVDHPKNETTQATLCGVEVVRDPVMFVPSVVGALPKLVEIFELREVGTDTWQPVSREEWIAVERQSGFQPKGIAVDDPAWRTTCATAGFGGQRYDGRIRYQ